MQSNKVTTKPRQRRMNKSDLFILALDPFVEFSYQANTFHLASILQARLGCAIEPVYVLGAKGRGLFLGEGDLEYWLELTDDCFSRLLGNVQNLKMEPSKILVQKSLFLRMDVKALISYAKSRLADAIIMGTQQKSALERGVFGSFAETIILYSNVPVIALPPKVRLGASLSPILFPTDLGNGSFSAFKRCMSFAKKIGANITVFHQYRTPHFVYPESVKVKEGTKWSAPTEKDGRFLSVKKKLGRWQSQADKSGVACSTKLIVNSINLAEAILIEAKANDYGLIAMVATKGPGKVWFTGSTPRQVLRDTKIPVWVYFSGVR